MLLMVPLWHEVRSNTSSVLASWGFFSKNRSTFAIGAVGVVSVCSFLSFQKYMS